MMRGATAAIGFAVAVGAVVAGSCGGVQAQTSAARPLQAVQSAPDGSSLEVSSQNRRPRTRVRIYRQDDRGVYPSYNPGPNAVRDCTATYVQEFRPSGTVIVPRMNCFWRPG